MEKPIKEMDTSYLDTNSNRISNSINNSNIYWRIDKLCILVDVMEENDGMYINIHNILYSCFTNK